VSVACYLGSLALQFVFNKFSTAPLVDVEKIVCLRNQLMMCLFCVVLTAIPLATGNYGEIDEDNHTAPLGCWIPDYSPAHPGYNPWRLTFFVPVIVINLVSIHLLVVVYRRRKLFVTDNRFLLIRLAAFTLTFVVQWLLYFVGAMIQYSQQRTDMVPGFSQCVIVLSGIFNWLVWGTRPGCVWKIVDGMCCCWWNGKNTELRRKWYTADEEVGVARLTHGPNDTPETKSGTRMTSADEIISISSSNGGGSRGRFGADLQLDDNYASDNYACESEETVPVDAIGSAEALRLSPYLLLKQDEKYRKIGEEVKNTDKNTITGRFLRNQGRWSGVGSPKKSVKGGGGQDENVSQNVSRNVPIMDSGLTQSLERTETPVGYMRRVDNQELHESLLSSPETSVADTSLNRSNTPREAWIVENMRRDVLIRAGEANQSLLSDDDQWERV